jgi:hypothetical protein
MLTNFFFVVRVDSVEDRLSQQFINFLHAYHDVELHPLGTNQHICLLVD